MKTMRKLLAVALLIFTLGLSAVADGQMETTKPTTPPGQSQTQPSPETPAVEDFEGDPTQTENGQMETTVTTILGVIETILALT